LKLLAKGKHTSDTPKYVESLTNLLFKG